MKPAARWLLAAACWLAALPVQAESDFFDKSPTIVLQWATPEISPRVRARIQSLLAQRARVEIWPADQACTGICAQSPLRLVIGPDPALSMDPVPISESFSSDSFSLAVSRTNPMQTLLQVSGRGRGLLYGSYAALEILGYRFWHPLAPTLPERLTVPPLGSNYEIPHYRARGFTHHTMHPLELSHVLNGWGPRGPDDAAGWEALLPEWESYLEWLIANRQNEVEWVLLEKPRWGDFARGPVRQQRLKRIVALGHDWQVRIGLDAPLALEQQNGWRLIPQSGSLSDELDQLHRNLDWLADTGVDFLSTELGTSEFTHGGASAMLAWLNAATDQLARRKLPFFTKIHISSGQQIEDYRDPESGEPLNINFLPYYADPRLGVMPHTVQIYALDDPAPTYGHKDFSEMHRFMRMVSGKRPMLWFPESAYWVNYDINVPLFLPVYARQRLHDLRLLTREGLDLEGQMIFSSGWQDGYWLNDLLAARAAWDPLAAQATDEQALRSLLSRQLVVFGPQADQILKLLLDTMDTQHRLLVLGQTGSAPPADISLRSGIAYLAGQDTWSQLAGTIRAFGLKGYQTQPERLSFEDLRDPAKLKLYLLEVAPLLQAMAYEFQRLATRADEIDISQLSDALRRHWLEIRHGLRLNALRADEVYALMEASASQATGQHSQAAAWLKRAHQAIAEAEAPVAWLSENFPGDAGRIAGWGRPNPTVYNYGYFWPARSLFFWKRDYEQVARGNFNPCLNNIIDPLEVALPAPEAHPGAGLVRTLAPLLGLGDCFAPKGRRDAGTNGMMD
ncbi:MAG TPA: hypothetical protein V6D23_19695 [Candidatus Obscuribacterales bacterium]